MSNKDFTVLNEDIITFNEPRQVLEIKLDEGATPPKKKYKGDAGADICANETVTIMPNSVVAVKTGNYFLLPFGFEAQIRSRSGLALNNKVFVLNSPGTIDQGYTGEIKVILYNIGEEPFVVNKGDRIAQVVLAPIVEMPIEIVDSLEKTDRGDSGFGSTGISG